MRSLFAAVLLVAVVPPAAAQTSPPANPAGVSGKLYKAVFSAGPGALQPSDLGRVDEPLRGRLARYLERRGQFKSRYASQPDTLEEVRADAKRRALERSIVALIEAPGVEGLAERFVSSAPIASEWNGLHTGPLKEAVYAEDLLKKDPGSPLAPWLYLFIAERQRIVFEASENEKDVEGMKAAARKYRTFVARARAADDPLFAAIVDDMDRQPYLYLKGSTHAREYDPDS